MTLPRPASRLVLVGGDPLHDARSRPTCCSTRSTTACSSLDGKKREAILHQVQRVLHEQVPQVPIYHLGFPIGVGPRVDDIMATAPPGFYMSPYEDLKLRAR